MGLIKSSETNSVAHGAVVLDLGDLSRQAEAIRVGARRDAEAIIAKAKEDRDAIVRGGREHGYEEGRRAGYDDGLRRGEERGRAQALEESAARLGAIESAWAEALSDFERARDEMLEEARDRILKVAAICAERVTKRVVELDRGIVVSQMEAVLGTVARGGRLSLLIHPDDEAIARDALPALLARLGTNIHTELKTDASIGRGSCVARMASGGEIDASIETQLQRVIEVLLPESDGALRDHPGDAAEESGGGAP